MGKLVVAFYCCCCSCDFPLGFQRVHAFFHFSDPSFNQQSNLTGGINVMRLELGFQQQSLSNKRNKEPVPNSVCTKTLFECVCVLLFLYTPPCGITCHGGIFLIEK